jgi:hypothetical protein
MVTLFANTLKASYYKHVMGSLTQKFSDVMVVVERIEQRVMGVIISMPTR